MQQALQIAWHADEGQEPLETFEESQKARGRGDIGLERRALLRDLGVLAPELGLVALVELGEGPGGLGVDLAFGQGEGEEKGA